MDLIKAPTYSHYKVLSRERMNAAQRKIADPVSVEGLFWVVDMGGNPIEEAFFRAPGDARKMRSGGYILATERYRQLRPGVGDFWVARMPPYLSGAGDIYVGKRTRNPAQVSQMAEQIFEAVKAEVIAGEETEEDKAFMRDFYRRKKAMYLGLIEEGVSKVLAARAKAAQKAPQKALTQAQKEDRVRKAAVALIPTALDHFRADIANVAV